MCSSPPPASRLQDFLRPCEGLSTTGRTLITNLLSGLSSDFIRLLDLVPKRSTLPLIAIVASCHAWRAHLGRFPALERLSSLLDDLVARCHKASAAQSALLVQDVKRFDGTRMAGVFDKGSVATMHVLPFVEDVSQRAVSAAFLLQEGINPITWPYPWGGLVRSTTACIIGSVSRIYSYRCVSITRTSQE